MSVTKPFLKWVGGKTQILEKVLDEFPTTMNSYHEPFLGGGSVLLGLLSYKQQGKITLSGTVYASDLNSNLIWLYKTIQSQPDALLLEVKKLTDEFSRCDSAEVNRSPATLEEALTSQESYYYWIRSRYNSLTAEEKVTPTASAMFLFLNKTCFRGIYREGPHGFNVPFGNYKHPSILDEAHIREVSTLIQDVVFTVRPFQESLQQVRAGDFVYLDPPYAPETTTSFVSYTKDGFGIENHRRLFQLCSEMKDRGVRFVLSNANVPLVTDSFLASDYTTKIVPCRRTINSRNPESTTTEVLITNQQVI